MDMTTKPNFLYSSACKNTKYPTLCYVMVLRHNYTSSGLAGGKKEEDQSSVKMKQTLQTKLEFQCHTLLSLKQ
jgi:hypothetical protein